MGPSGNNSVGTWMLILVGSGFSENVFPFSKNLDLISKRFRGSKVADHLIKEVCRFISRISKKFEFFAGLP